MMYSRVPIAHVCEVHANTEDRVQCGNLTHGGYDIIGTEIR